MCRNIKPLFNFEPVATEDEIRAAGGRVLVVETSGLPNYEPTRRFYLKLGYRHVATIPDFYAEAKTLLGEAAVG